MKKCLVLGGGGFLGSHLCETLLEAGFSVRVFERRGCPRGNVAHLEGKLEWREGDFLDPQEVRDSVGGMEAVFHLIGTTLPQSSNEDPVRDISSNLLSTLQLLEMCWKSGVKKVIFYSSGGTVYGIPRQVPIPEDHPTNPLCSYGIHKLAIEKYLHLFHLLHGLDYAVLRVSNPYGERQNPSSGQGAVAVFLDRISRGEPVEIWGDGSVTRDYIHVSDVTRASLAALESQSEEKLFNIGTGRGLSLLNVIDEIEKVLGRRVEVRFKPGRRADVPVNVLSIDRAREVLGWSPRVSFRQGLERMLSIPLATRPLTPMEKT